MTLTAAAFLAKYTTRAPRATDPMPDLFARADRVISRDCPHTHCCEVFEGSTKLLDVHALLFWDDRPGCVLKQGGMDRIGRQIDFRYRNADDIRLVFNLENARPDTARAVRDYYAWCPIAEFRMPE